MLKRVCNFGLYTLPDLPHEGKCKLCNGLQGIHPANVIELVPSVNSLFGKVTILLG